MHASRAIRRAGTARARAPAGWGELAGGLALVGAAIAASSLVAARHSPAPTNPAVRADYKRLEKPSWTPPDWLFGIWGPLYGAMALAGLRLWTARPGAPRSRALAHFLAAQGLDAAWMWLGFGRRARGAMAAEAALTVANAAALVDAARAVDRPAAWMLAPYAAWISFAALLSEELWRRNR